MKKVPQILQDWIDVEMATNRPENICAAVKARMMPVCTVQNDRTVLTRLGFGAAMALNLKTTGNAICFYSQFQCSAEKPVGFGSFLFCQQVLYCTF